MEHRKPEVPINTIERRLERLERDSRRWKAMTTLAMGALSLVLLIGAGKSDETSVPNEVQAHAFVLVDRNGTPLARLGLLPHGAWGLACAEPLCGRLPLQQGEDGLCASIRLRQSEGAGLRQDLEAREVARFISKVDVPNTRLSRIDVGQRD